MNNSILNPTRSFGGLMEDLLNGNHARFFKDDLFTEDWVKHQHRIPVNISENSDAYLLEAVAPGLKKEDLKVQVTENVLNISFEKSEENKEDKSENKNESLRREFILHSFKRSFKLSNKIDAEKISARYDSGILYLEIPKKEQIKTANKTIEIA